MKEKRSVGKTFQEEKVKTTNKILVLCLLTKSLECLSSGWWWWWCGGGAVVVGAWQARLQTGHYALWPPAVQGSATLWTPHCTNFLQHGKARSSVEVIETVKEAQRPFWGREFHGTGR